MVYDKSGATSGQISPCAFRLGAACFPKSLCHKCTTKGGLWHTWYISVFLGINGDCYLNGIAIGVII